MNRRNAFRRLGGLALGAAALAMAGTVGGSAAEPLKVAFVYVSPVSDAGWTFQHETARRELQQALGDKIKTSFVENVSEGADAERVIRELAANGNKVIFTTSFGFMNPTIKVAKQFPNVIFEHATGYKRAKNVGTYSARFYEARYLTGMVAGKMTKTNTLGYVAAFPIPEVVQGIDAFTLGARAVNPKAEVKVIWTSAWYDPGKEREATDTLIAQGADIVTHHTDSTAVVQEAEAKHIYAIAYHSDMSKYGPHAQLTAAVHHWGQYYIREVKAVLAGTWKSGDVWGGIKDGMVDIAPLNPVVPKDVAALVETRKGDIAAGRFQPFQGPIDDNHGKLRVPAGKALTDKEILSLNWYVAGVQGELPK
ncbi:MAG TPA: BMP family ABC transporter substrate-binding protein [Alphaproteobacteria bacterium]|nr:BMP family ABC transporter substrate-binding protein [Alphaproteobacteria bacterium]